MINLDLDNLFFHKSLLFLISFLLICKIEIFGSEAVTHTPITWTIHTDKIDMAKPKLALLSSKQGWIGAQLRQSSPNLLHQLVDDKWIVQSDFQLTTYRTFVLDALSIDDLWVLWSLNSHLGRTHSDHLFSCLWVYLGKDRLQAVAKYASVVSLD